MIRNGRSILVAEDNRVFAEVLRFNLQHAGFDVTVAQNGAVALDHLKQQSFELLITDYQMPIVDGEQLCKAVRQQLCIEQMPIVICSAKGYEFNREVLAAQYKIAKFVFKPFSMREMVSIAQELTVLESVTLNV